MKRMDEKSLHLNLVCSIKDKPLRFFYVAREEETCEMYDVRSSFDALDASMCPRGPLNGFNLSHYNSLDKQLGLNHFKTVR